MHLLALKEALHTLKDSGADGFEGLLASVLSEICGQPFRLASSGSQRGRDGDSAFDDGATYFEAKLYQGGVPRSTVSNKILDLINDNKGQVDTWALCATSEISTQHAELYRQSLAKAGIGCLIVDWPDHTLPSLAVLLAMAPPTTEQFLKDHSTEKSKVADVRIHLEAITADAEFAKRAAGLRDTLREPILGLGIAKAANKAWLMDTFSDRTRARQFFGQPLAPLDPTGLTWIERTVLIASLAGAFSGTPDETVFLVIGEEGTGKSWLAAKAWMAIDPLPLLVVFTADELKMPMAMHDLEGLFIGKLAAQTGDTLTEAAKLRWQRRFRSWRENPQPTNIRMTVWVDGLNQAPDFPWPHWIDAVSKFLLQIGGKLVVTTNERHFAQRIRGVVTSQVRRIVVTEWSEEDLKSILASKRIESDRLSVDVFDFLRNPRILGIASELLDAKDIERFEELTVGRLLFEHIRRCERDGTTDIPAQDFVRGLQTHADTIIRRLSRQQPDDLKLFDSPLDDRLKAVSLSRFFASVPGECDLYAIRDDGLPLALGLSLISALRKEQRNGRDPAARLGQIVEPILALAKTSEVIFSALQVACSDTECPVAVTAALARFYVSLQNLPDTQWPAFEALVRAAPAAFVQAAHDVALSGSHFPNMRWLTLALLTSRDGHIAKAETSAQVTRWLSYYSLSPEMRMFADASRDPREKVEAERAKRQAEIENKQSALSAAERNFIEMRLIRKDETGLSNLHLLSFELLAGMPLSAFADALVNWAFSDALNSSLHSPSRQFEHLVRLNIVDWHETRKALLKSCAPLMSPGISTTGQWALVTILRATGDSDDATRAHEIVERLTKDRPRFSGGSRVEMYCTTDPCDPKSERPDNISKTASAYQALDVASLRQGMGHSPKDYFFSDARPGVVRFEPQVAIDVQRKFALNVTDRDGLPRRQGILALVASSALLDTEIVDRLIRLARAINADAFDSSSDKRDSWITAQYALRAALPHKTGNEQLEIIASLSGRWLLVSLLEHLRPADEKVVEDNLERILQSGDVDAQARILVFINYSGSPLSARARQGLSRFLKSKDRLVRTQALGIVANLRDTALLKQIVEGGWDARTLEHTKDYYELWYGSSALVAAAESGLIDPAEVVDRIAVSFYGFAVKRLADAAGKIVAARIDAALTRAANLIDIPDIPVVERPIPQDNDRAPPLASLVDQTPSSDIQQFFDRANETDEAFQARQKRSWRAFDRFSKELTMADARIILDDVSWDGLAIIVTREPALAKSWVSLLNGASGRILRSLHFFALGLATAIAKVDTAAAVTMFRRLSAETPLVNRVFGPAKIPAETIAIWSGAKIPEIKALCFERLDRAANDSEIAIEVLAAFSEGMQAEIKEYVDIKLAVGIPSTTARALMVLGFSDHNQHASETLERFAGRSGFLGRACDAACYAYERNNWARQWFEKMKVAKTPDEFWRHAVLLAKVVDGRYAIWRKEGAPCATAFLQFFPTVNDQINERINRWQEKRQKTLFGQDVPDPIFLTAP